MLIAAHDVGTILFKPHRLQFTTFLCGGKSVSTTHLNGRNSGVNCGLCGSSSPLNLILLQHTASRNN